MGLVRGSRGTKLGSSLLSGLFIGALLAGMGLNALLASPSTLLDYYAPGSPGAPTAASAAPGNGNVTLHWHVPTSIGIGPISAYVVTPYIGFVPQPTRTFGASTTTQVITGLTNGKSYFFKVAAINSVGFGPQSVSSNLVRVGAPGTPTSVDALPAKNQATLHWFAPTITNGKPINGYVVTPFLTGVAQTVRVFNSVSTIGVVKGLLNGRSYTFRVAARNANGAGLASASSPAVLVAGAPAPPLSINVTRVGAGQLRVGFFPGNNNGLAITSFTATCTSTDGGLGRSKSIATRPIVVGGLSPGRTYTCNVRATNARGTGGASTKSKRVVA